MALYRRDIEEIRKLRNSATRKLARIDRNEKLNLRNSKHDPRMSIGAEMNMTRKEINAYKQGLRQFVSRETQFVRGNNGAVLSGSKVRAYRSAERQAARAGKQYYSQFKGAMNSLNDPVDNVMKQRDSIHHLPSGSPRSENIGKKRSMRGVTSNDALDRLTADKMRQTKEYFSGDNAYSHKQEILAMYRRNGDREGEEKFRQLSLEQVEFIYNFEPQFMAGMSLSYEAAMAELNDGYIVETIMSGRQEQSRVIEHAAGLNF